MTVLPAGHFTLEDQDTEPYQEDPHTHQAIADSYIRFKKHISALSHQLGLFLSECRQLGRSYALILAAKDVREGLENLLSKFYDNAAHLSPLLPEPGPTDNANSAAGVESFPFWLEGVATACENFRERLNEFREYTDESVKVKSLMGFFGKDLRYRASCLKEYSDKLDTDYMRYYIHDLADEMGDDLGNMVSAFTFFNDYGMPAMQYEQRRDTDIVLNMSTVATFFSAVTVTTLQMSVDRASADNAKNFQFLSVVNTFLFGSLVLSIGAALNSLLAVAWKRTPYGSRGRRLPLWITIWIHASAPVFLALSIMSFSAGLALFAHASDQASHTKYVTWATTAITTFGIVTIGAWFGYEQWVAPLLLPNAPWRPFIKRDHEWKKKLSESKPSRPKLADHRRSRTGSLSNHSDGSTRSSFNIIPPMISSRLPVSNLLDRVAALGRQDAAPEQPRSSDLENQAPRSPTQGGEPQGRPRPRAHWVHSAKLVTSLKSVTNVFRQGSPSTVTSPTVTVAHTPAPAYMETYTSPFLLSVPSMPLFSLPHQHGVLQDLEYSPDGLFLATTSYDKVAESSTTIVYTTSSNYAIIYRYRHHQLWTSKQVSWSPKSDRLLVRLDHSIDILDERCILVSSVKRPHLVESVAWVSCDFLSVERSTVFKISIQGQVLTKYRFDNLLLRDIAVVPNTSLLLVAGRVMHSRQEILPSNSRAEKQFILYDTKSGKNLSRHPVLDDVRYIRLARSLSSVRDGYDVLLSHKNRPSPRIWTLQPQLSGSHQLKPATISLHPSLELTGHGCFLGEQDQMMACVGPGGDIHIWDRETARLVQRIEAHAVNHGVRCFAWRPHSAPSATFASADGDGLKIWSIEQLNEEPRDSPFPSEPSGMLPNHTRSTTGQSSVLGTAVTFDEPFGLTESSL
ncbi:WD40-repeat-containing domain protein [Lyophyllum atratum]|nr:WD40-repeat-containing domain protein [Lyophyllum atratum]